MSTPGGEVDDVRLAAGPEPGDEQVGADDCDVTDGPGGTDGARSVSLRRLASDPRSRVGAVLVVAVALGVLVGVLMVGGGNDAAPAVISLPEQTLAAPAETAALPVATVAEAPVPTRLTIPDLAIDQGLVELTVGDDGRMGVPTEWMDIGWWAGGPRPGEAGGAVIAGHVNGGGSPAVFAQLPTLAVGAEVVVAREDGSTAAYVVRSREQFPKDDFPDARVYTLEGPSYLHLVTCGGAFDTRSGHYDDNIVVFAELVGITPA